jgi:kynureninase
MECEAGEPMMEVAEVSRERAQELDSQDSLAAYRDQFVIADPALIYLDGNSLGRLPKGVMDRVQQAVEIEWGERLIRGWNEGWWELSTRIGESMSPLLGADSDEILVSDQTSLNLFKLASAALGMQAGRTRVITDRLNFPSDLYILQGLIRLLGDRHTIVQVASVENDIAPDLKSLEQALDAQTALLTLSHVTFKSGYLYDMQAITELAHRHGALVAWDLSHSAGSVPIELDRCNVDFAVGCTYKYLNGGPGAPAFLYVNRALHESALSPIWGWWGERQPFAFENDYQPGPGARRFLTGTAPILSLCALQAGLAPILAAGIRNLREKSTALTDLAVKLVDARLQTLGFTLGSPRDPARRGSHISIRHPEGYRISRALIEEMNVVPDYREPDNIRIGFAPLYTSFLDVWEGVDRIRRVITEDRFSKYPRQKLTVT